MRFGGIVAVNDVSIEVSDGEVVGLIGTNGAGQVDPDERHRWVRPLLGEGRAARRRRSRGRSSAARARMGLGRSFQAATLFPELTVRDTVLVALEARDRTGMLIDRGVLAAAPSARSGPSGPRPTSSSTSSGLGRYADTYIGDLSTGTRRIVELAGLLALDARVLCLDEPTAGVAQRETEAFGPLILELRRELGASMLVIEHDMPLIMGISDRVYCLETGAVIAEGLPDEVRNDPAVDRQLPRHRRAGHRPQRRDPRGDSVTNDLGDGPSTPVAAARFTGSRVHRVEDARLLTGHGTFVDDVVRPGMLHACFVRSPFPRARVLGIDSVGGARPRGRPRRVHRRRPQPGRARALVLDDRQGRPRHAAPAARRGRGPLRRRSRRPRRRRRPLPRRGCRRARRGRLRAAHAGGRLRRRAGGLRARPRGLRGQRRRPPARRRSRRARRRRSGRPPHVVSEEIHQQAYAAVPMETRGLVVEWSGGELTIWAATQSPHEVRAVASRVLGLDEHRIRVIMRDTGGGVRPEGRAPPGGHLPDARRPEGAGAVEVDRGPAREPDVGGAGSPRARPASAWRSPTTARSWAPASTTCRTSAPTPRRGRSAPPPPSGCCSRARTAIPKATWATTSVFSNTPGRTAYRGPWAFESVAREVLLDIAARRIGIDPVELRRRNFLGRDDLPVREPRRHALRPHVAARGVRGRARAARLRRVPPRAGRGARRRPLPRRRHQQLRRADQHRAWATSAPRAPRSASSRPAR